MSHSSALLIPQSIPLYKKIKQKTKHVVAHARRWRSLRDRGIGSSKSFMTWTDRIHPELTETHGRKERGREKRKEGGKEGGGKRGKEDVK